MTVLPCLAAVALAAALLPGDGNGQDAVAAAIARYQEAFDRIDRARPEYEALRRSAIEEAAAGLPFATLAAADALFFPLLLVFTAVALGLGAALFHLSVQFAMPVILIVFAINLGLGMVGRAVPKVSTCTETGCATPMA